MHLKCPSCGIVASSELWANNGDAAPAFVAALRLPKAVQGELLAYLALFRPDARALSWGRVASVVEDLEGLVRAGYVTIDKQVPRKCPPELWAEGMREMVDRKGGQKMHLKNHNYLRAVVYPKANAYDAQDEKRREKLLQDASGKGRREHEHEEMSPESKREWEAMKKKLGLT
jgi:hypothetical protein